MREKKCYMDRRLEITYNEKYNKIFLGRCCYVEPFIGLDPEKVDDLDIFSLAIDDKYIHKRILGSEASCPLDQFYVCNKILPDIKVVTVGVSHACNLNCYHCFHVDHNDSLYQKSLYFKLLEKIKGHNLDVIHMQSSGEVFFYYFKIKDYLKSLTVNDTKEVNFQSNGLLLNQNRIHELYEISQKTNIKYTFSFSVDAVTEETYLKTRGGNFNKLLENISDTISIFGKDVVVFTFTIKKPNAHEAAQFKDFIMKKFNYTSYDPTFLSFDYYDNSCQEYYKFLQDSNAKKTSSL